MSSMKIGFVSIGNIYDRKLWSGTISFLADELSKKYSIVPIFISNKPRRFFAKIYKIFNLTSVLRIPFLGRYILQSKISHSNCDIFFVPSGSEIIGRCRFPEDKYVIYLSDATYHLMLDYYYYNESKKKIQYFNNIEYLALKRANIVIESSEWAAKDVVSYYKINSSKVFTLPFGSNLPDRYYGKKYLNHNIIRLLLIGVDWKRKGIDIAIETVRILNEVSDSRYELTIVGFNQPNSQYEDYIHFAGRLNKNLPEDVDRLVNYYLSSDIFILPTQAECSAIVYSEAAMYGLPVFTYKTGGTETYVDSGYNGYCLNPGSTANDFAELITKFINSGEYSTFSLNARKKYEMELSWSNWFNSFNNLLSRFNINRTV
ncbi:glycosyltransferase family 4 protein [Bifidobacterium olomucense]|uniref:Glycosyl transferase group 1 n=1 Tax=Bifidobacterium olomucense TaxID=2675324 RepID=A0A7Y0EZJ2_9BIFI|nr:glycosyltransferase family 4 protein [Bifidobacterium sp. DSM 109959]NMM99278.1 glycosyl transferase group 1 [Bifidobacterium sp. DSM 109959]